MNITREGKRLTCTETVEIAPNGEGCVSWSPGAYVLVRDVRVESSASPVHLRYAMINSHRIVCRWARDPLLTPGENLVVLLVNVGNEVGRAEVTIEADMQEIGAT
jgi:hypothetical protein